MLVEVRSPTTEGYDRGEKLEHYKRAEPYGPGSTARLASVDAELPADAVYRNPLPD